MADSDRDGLPDQWEIASFGNLDQTPTGDFDGDGFSNRAEYWAGTNPNDPQSFLRITLVQATPNGLRIDWQGGSNGVPVLQHSLTLQSNDWFDVANGLPGSSFGTFTVTNLPIAGQPRFFRIQRVR